MYTKKDLLDDLYKMGAPRDRVVIAHSSLRAVGDVEGGGETVLEALIEYFASEEYGGVLLIPTHTWRGSEDVTHPALDLNCYETCIGVLPNLAAAHPRAKRSLHPTHSVAAFSGGDGRKAEEYIAGEVNVDTMTGPNGCYGRLIECGGKVFLIGVDHSADTFLHSVEEILDVPNRTSDYYRQTWIKLKSGDIIERPVRVHFARGLDGPSKHYPKFEPAFRAFGAVEDGRFGNAKTQLCDTGKMLEAFRTVRERSGGIELCGDAVPLKEEWYK